MSRRTSSRVPPAAFAAFRPEEEIEDEDDDEEEDGFAISSRRFRIGAADPPPPQQQQAAAATVVVSDDDFGAKDDYDDDDFFGALDADAALAAIAAADEKILRDGTLLPPPPPPPPQPPQPPLRSLFPTAAKTASRARTRAPTTPPAFPGDPSAAGPSPPGGSKRGKSAQQQQQQQTQQPQYAFPPAENDPPPEVDAEAAQTWVYPVNFEKREYQYAIVREALFANTLVSLPTGLGKTFVAAVVMFNFYRWFPNGKILFIAPTRPLVAQQIEACHSIVGIPSSEQCELTGHTSPAERASLWGDKRVFFLTAQVVANDIENKICPAAAIRCLVFDEAHRAQKRHAYCQVIEAVARHTRHFRVLALSASPGASLHAIQDVISNLLISRIEARKETDADVAPYLHTKDVEVVEVKLDGKLLAVKQQFTKLLRAPIDKLVDMDVYYERNIDKGSVYKLKEARSRMRTRPNFDPNVMAAAESQFALAMTLYHPYSMLTSHGLVPFLANIRNIQQDALTSSTRYKRELLLNHEWKNIIEMTESAVEGLAATSGHPKIEMLKTIIQKHFAEKQDTRVMIFTQYRDSVQEIFERLKSLPGLRVASFVGQSTGRSGTGIKQKDQLSIIHKFRGGEFNVLVATIIGEEGLDIGEVDLIVCFDSQTSPTRLVQRMGRTGRKRDGRVVVLVSEGDEAECYKRSNVRGKMLQGALIFNPNFKLCDSPARMLPEGISPKPVESVMVDAPDFVGEHEVSPTKRKKQRIASPLLAEEQRANLLRFFGGSLPEQFDITSETTSLFPSKIMPTRYIGHSQLTLHLVDVLRSVDEKLESKPPELADAAAPDDEYHALGDVDMFYSPDVVAGPFRAADVQEAASPVVLDSDVDKKVSELPAPQAAAIPRQEAPPTVAAQAPVQAQPSVPAAAGPPPKSSDKKTSKKRGRPKKEKSKSKKRDSSDSSDSGSDSDSDSHHKHKHKHKKHHHKHHKHHHHHKKKKRSESPPAKKSKKQSESKKKPPAKKAKPAAPPPLPPPQPQPPPSAPPAIAPPPSPATPTKSSIARLDAFMCDKESKPQVPSAPPPKADVLAEPAKEPQADPPLDHPAEREQEKDAAKAEESSAQSVEELFPVSQSDLQVLQIPDFSSPSGIVIPPPPSTLLKPPDNSPPKQQQQPPSSVSTAAKQTTAEDEPTTPPQQRAPAELRMPYAAFTPPRGPFSPAVRRSPTPKKLRHLRKVDETPSPAAKKAPESRDESQRSSPGGNAMVETQAIVEGFASEDEEEDDGEEQDSDRYTGSFINDDEEDYDDLEVEEEEEEDEGTSASRRERSFNERALHAASLLSQETLRPRGFRSPQKARPGKFKMVFSEEQRKRQSAETKISAAKVPEVAAASAPAAPERPPPFLIADAELAATMRDAMALRVVACPFVLPSCNAAFGTAAVPSVIVRLRQQRHSAEEVSAVVERCSQLVGKYRVILVLERTLGSGSFSWDPRLRSVKGVRVLETPSAGETARMLETIVTGAPELRAATEKELLPALSSDNLARAQSKIEHLVAEVPRITLHDAVAIALAFDGPLQDIHDSSAEDIQRTASVSIATALAVHEALHPQFDLCDLGFDEVE